MKRLILVNGTMGVGKTATCRELLHMLRPGVFLDGDWCWNMEPFVVTDETKNMVMENITCLLRNFLSCSQYESVLFCWVMHEESILKDLLSRLEGLDFRVYRFTLTATEQALRARILKDVECHLRDIDGLERSLQRLRMYDTMHTIKIDVSAVTPREAAEQIFQRLQAGHTN
jgi:chloramphenicol 3-O-phosphotransferase